MRFPPLTLRFPQSFHLFGKVETLYPLLTLGRERLGFRVSTFF